MMSRLLSRPPAKALAILLVAMLCTPGVALAQAPPADGGAKPFKPEELEQIAAPIALYPDPLVAQVLMASTYPLEVIQAARFVKASPNLTGSTLEDELKKYDWDDSVKALVPFPQVLSMMNDKLDWMQKLGDAFLAQQKELMDTIQQLRQKAQAQGHLKDTKEQKVIVEPAPAPPAGQPTQQTTVIKIEPADPQVVYVPTYNPTVVYGAWPYPAYPPYSYYPPGYAFAGAAFGFAAGVAVGAAWGWAGSNWGRGEVDIDVNKSNNFSKNVNRGDVAAKRSERQGNRDTFQHNPEHRKGAQYRDSATQQRFDRSGPANAQSREQFRGRAEQGRQDTGRGGQQGAGGLGDRGAGAGQGGAGDRGAAGRGQGDRAGAGAGQGRGSAFEGAGGGAAARADSARGNASRDSFNASRGSAGGGGARSGSFQSSGSSRGGSSFSGGGSRGSSGFSGGGGGARGGGGGGGRGGGGGGRGGGGRR